MTNEKQTTENGGEIPVITTVLSESAPRFTYARYLACGGRIDEENYLRVMKRAKEETLADFAFDQTKVTADISGISLESIAAEVGIDPRVIYGILRHDDNLGESECHHAQMSDQLLLVEALRMLEQSDAVAKIISQHPHMDMW